MISKIKYRFFLKLIAIYRLLERKSYAYCYNFPLGKQPKTTRDVYLQLASEARQFKYYEIDKFEIESGYAIDKVWLDELALHTQVVKKNSILCYAHGRVLYAVLSKYIKKYQSLHSSISRLIIFETGTARGFSTLCMARALQDQNQSATIVTFDILPHKTKMYWNCIDDCDGPRTRAELLRPWENLLQEYIVFHQGDTKVELPKVKVERIHFAFLDGVHTYEDVMFEFEQINDYQISGDIVVYDDYTPSQYPGLVKAVDEICKLYNYRRSNLKAHNGRGYVITVKE